MDPTIFVDIVWNFAYTLDSLYLEHPLSRTSLYVELMSRSLCVGCNLFFSLYLELSLSRTNLLVPCEFEIERVNCSIFIWFFKNIVRKFLIICLLSYFWNSSCSKSKRPLVTFLMCFLSSLSQMKLLWLHLKQAHSRN